MAAFRALSLVFTVFIAAAFQQPRNSAASAEETEVYRIYSQMLTNPATSHGPDNNPRYLIQGVTRLPIHDEPCVTPPRNREADFKDVLADFQRRKATPRELKPLFSIGKPYVLLSADEVKAFSASRDRTVDRTPPDERFRGVTDLFTLTDVYFNPSHTLALTGISTWCGGLCALSKWKVFEKVATDKWEERPWVNCVSMAGFGGRLTSPRGRGL